MPTIALLTPTRPGFHEAPTADETASIAAHFAYLARLAAEGRVLTAGPCEDGSLGIVVFPKADEATALELMQADPAVVAGVFRLEVKPWRMSLLGHGTGRDWTGFVQAVHVRTTPAEAWAMFASPAGIVRWFTSGAATTRGGRPIDDDQTFEIGDRIRFVWVVPAPESQRTAATPTVEMPEVDEVLAFEPGRRLRHGWYEGKGWMEYRVLPSGEQDRVTIEFEQRMDPANEFPLLESAYIGCREGWAFYITNLKAVLEYGVDLREKRPDRGSLVNV